MFESYLSLSGVGVALEVDDEGKLWMEGGGCDMSFITGKEEARQLIEHLKRVYELEEE